MVNDLNHRSNDGYDVQLVWDDVTNECSIIIAYNEGVASFVVPNDKCNDAFKHPFVYMDAALEKVGR